MIILLGYRIFMPMFGFLKNGPNGRYNWNDHSVALQSCKDIGSVFFQLPLMLSIRFRWECFFQLALRLSIRFI